MCPQSEVYKNNALDYYCWHAPNSEVVGGRSVSLPQTISSYWGLPHDCLDLPRFALSTKFPTLASTGLIDQDFPTPPTVDQDFSTEMWNVTVCESPKVSDSVVSLARQWFALITNEPNTVRVWWTLTGVQNAKITRSIDLVKKAYGENTVWPAVACCLGNHKICSKTKNSCCCTTIGTGGYQHSTHCEILRQIIPRPLIGHFTLKDTCEANEWAGSSRYRKYITLLSIFGASWFALCSKFGSQISQMSSCHKVVQMAYVSLVKVMACVFLLKHSVRLREIGYWFCVCLCLQAGIDPSTPRAAHWSSVLVPLPCSVTKGNATEVWILVPL